MPTPYEDPITLAIHKSVFKSKKINSSTLDSRISSTSSKILETKIGYSLYEPSLNNFSLSDIKKKCISLKQHTNSFKTSSKSIEENGINESLYPKPLVHTWRHSQRDKVGLKNVGNTCYLNATLQALFHIPSFYNWILNDDHCKHFKKTMECGCINCAIYKILRIFFTTSNSAFSPDPVIHKLNYISKNSFNLGRQEDAHEFLRLLLEKMDQDFMEKNFGKERIAKFPPSLKITTPIYKIFGGMMRTTVKCNNCNDTSTTFNPFLDLSLDIARSRSIQDALNLFFDVERVDYQCMKCRIKGVAQKQFLIKSVPKLLCLHLKRFHNNHSKFNGPIPFTKTLDLSKYVIKTLNNSLPVNKKLTYTFVASINHHGPNLSCGHYTTYAITANKQTAIFDDEQVDFIHYSQTNIDKDMYVLFYQLEEILSQNVSSNSSASNHISSKNSEVIFSSTINGKRKNDNFSYSSSKFNGSSKRPCTSLELLSQYGNGHSLDQTDTLVKKEHPHSFVTIYSKQNGESSELKRDFKKGLKEIRLIESNCT